MRKQKEGDVDCIGFESDQQQQQKGGGGRKGKIRQENGKEKRGE